MKTNLRTSVDLAIYFSKENQITNYLHFLTNKSNDQTNNFVLI